MPALPENSQAPVFRLKGTDGATYHLKETLDEAPVVLLAFFKVSCPVCQFAFPYVERLYRSYRSLPIWGISQDDLDATVQFARMYGLTFPMLLDEALETTVQYDLTNVPSFFLVSKGLTIAQTTIGWVKSELIAINEKLASHASQQAVPLFTAADEVPDLKPG